MLDAGVWFVMEFGILLATKPNKHVSMLHVNQIIIAIFHFQTQAYAVA